MTRKKTKNKKISRQSMFFYIAVVIVMGLAVAVSTIMNMREIIKAGIWDNDVVLSPPVGTDILPGGGLEAAEDVKTSFIFAKLIPFTIDYGIKLAIGLSVIAVIFGGYQYLTAYGNTEKQQAAAKTIIYALLGLVLALTAYGIVVMITSIRLS